MSACISPRARDYEYAAVSHIPFETEAANGPKGLLVLPILLLQPVVSKFVDSMNSAINLHNTTRHVEGTTVP